MRSKRRFVKAAGTIMEIVKSLSHAVSNLGGDETFLRRIISDEKLAGEIAELLVRDSVRLYVYYMTDSDISRTFYDRYAFASPKHRKELGAHHFTQTRMFGNDYATIELLRLDGSLTRSEVESVLKKRGLRFPTLTEVESFASSGHRSMRRVDSDPDSEPTFIALIGSWLSLKQDDSRAAFFAEATFSPRQKITLAKSAADQKAKHSGPTIYLAVQVEED